MGISHMKDELHAKLWQAQQRWFSLKDRGYTKHDLKIKGIRERGVLKMVVFRIQQYTRREESLGSIDPTNDRFAV